MVTTGRAVVSAVRPGYIPTIAVKAVSFNYPHGNLLHSCAAYAKWTDLASSAGHVVKGIHSGGVIWVRSEGVARSLEPGLVWELLPGAEKLV
ncbi:hypothetical protein M407DRAFT_242755 [Tulasnella calospora MUT 4182]|uniref:Uncharacterized protein n=1 Tax=Tulasnella calospora MUT 4182 TaxID=1051891 RepID=A0A0C3L5F2_9AGAM|nr:hypothetical protein M407DRAFT_242755 [Tulasnella calospora MUT 4182]